MNIDAPIQSIELEAALTEWAVAETQTATLEPRDDFLTKARRAARMAEAFRKLRSQARQTGFKALPLPDYLVELARAARVSLGALLPAVVREASPAAPWIALARGAGIPSDVIRLLARLWMAVHHAEWETAPVLARESPGTSIHQSLTSLPPTINEVQLEATLTAVERNYSAEARRLLAEALVEIK